MRRVGQVAHAEDALALEALLVSRAHLYTLFHKCFGGTPTAELLEAAYGEDTRSVVDEYAADNASMAGLLGFLEALAQDGAEELIDQVKDEFIKVMEIIEIIFKALSFENFEAQISLRDPNDTTKYVGSDENWAKAEAAIVEACKEKNLPAKVEYGEAAFYGPKLDFMVKDALGRRWQLGTIQVDYNLPERFELEYIGSDNQKHRPVMIHRAPFGSMERFCAVLIEHTGGKFPLWLTPEQFIILPVSEKYVDDARAMLAKLEDMELRGIIDERSEKIGRKIRDAELGKYPFMLIMGEKEVGEGTVSVRRQGAGDMGAMTPEAFAKMISEEIEKVL